MKLKLFIAAAVIAGITACEEPYQATDTVVVAPAGTQTAFTTQYPYARNIVWTNYDANYAIPVDWEFVGWTPMDANDYLVRFDLDNDNYYAWYDDAGNWIGTAYVVRDFTTLPTAVTNAINNQFSGYTISSVNREFQRDRMAYEVEIKNSTTKQKLLIDENGNIIKQKSKML
jgi:hypothetical protein